MRPLAKAVTKTLEKVRSLIREQCLSPAPVYSETIHENLKIFDRLFAEFEFSYVSCMVHVKTVKGRVAGQCVMKMWRLKNIFVLCRVRDSAGCYLFVL